MDESSESEYEKSDSDPDYTDEQSENDSVQEIYDQEDGEEESDDSDEDSVKKLISVKFPANVVNEENAINKLGGLNAISQAVEAKTRRLELRFHPNNGYNKPACGDKNTTCGFLLRVRVKKHRNNEMNVSSMNVETNSSTNNHDISMDTAMERINLKQEVHNSQNESIPVENDYANTQENEICEIKVLGKIDTEFRFQGLCDFQHLPCVPKDDDPETNKCIYESLFPIGIPPASWLHEEVPYFLPPAAFSRMDSIQQYVPKTDSTDGVPKNVIGKTRKRRAGLSNVAYFKDKTVPEKPPKGIATAMRIKFLQAIHLEKIKKLFEERPIWAKNAIIYQTRFTPEQIRVLLPSVAYYFANGPWRIMWVKLGFDPRKDPLTRIYQTLDYRLKAMHGLQSSVKCKRNYAEYSLPYKNTPSGKAKPMVITQNPSTDKLSEKRAKQLKENVYVYREGMVPPSRQMFYQYIDVKVPEIQEMLDKLPDPSPELKCHEKYGWMPKGFDDRCREILNKQVRNVLRKILNVPEDYPTKLPAKKRATFDKRRYVKPKAARKKASSKNAAQTSDEEWQNPGPSTSTGE